MFDGIGIETIGGILVVIMGGKLTPLNCYAGLAPGSGDGLELVQPIGSLGCEYDVERLRFFVEHLSSPASGSDSPGFNHAGVKYIFPVAPFTAYLGGSFALDSDQNNMGNLMGIVGIETGGDVRLYVEHVRSLTDFDTSYTVSGVKFVF